MMSHDCHLCHPVSFPIDFVGHKLTMKVANSNQVTRKFCVSHKVSCQALELRSCDCGDMSGMKEQANM